jgi:guanylate kinase
MGRGPLIILSGPSGAGKSTAVARLLRETKYPLRVSVSATTRPKRDGETDGVHYHFWTREQFEDELRRDGFLEWAKVVDSYYGTLKAEVEPYREKGVGVILVIDVQGAAQVRTRCPDHLSVFMRTSSQELLEKRLRGRGTEDEATIQRRLANARKELERASEYHTEVLNDDLATAVARLGELVEGEFRKAGNHA